MWCERECDRSLRRRTEFIYLAVHICSEYGCLQCLALSAWLCYSPFPPRQAIEAGDHGSRLPLDHTSWTRPVRFMTPQRTRQWSHVMRDLPLYMGTTLSAVEPGSGAVAATSTSLRTIQPATTSATASELACAES